MNFDNQFFLLNSIKKYNIPPSKCCVKPCMYLPSVAIEAVNMASRFFFETWCDWVASCSLASICLPFLRLDAFTSNICKREDAKNVKSLPMETLLY